MKNKNHRIQGTIFKNGNITETELTILESTVLRYQLIYGGWCWRLKIHVVFIQLYDIHFYFNITIFQQTYQQVGLMLQEEILPQFENLKTISRARE